MTQPFEMVMRWLELKIPPLLLVVIVGGLISLVASVFSEFRFQVRHHRLIAIAIALTGLATSSWGAREFHRVKTTFNPTKPSSSSALVDTGIYQITRNPMYLGFLLVLAGWAFGSGSLPSFLFLPAFVIYMNRFQIIPEERALSLLFGEKFTRYCDRVRRWI